MNDAMLRAACDAERAHDGASPCHFCPERCGNDALAAAIRAAVDETADEIEQLRAALRDTHQVLWQARLYLGYSSAGPLNTPFAERAEKQARSLLERER